MTLPIAHIFNGELGFDVRTKLNDLIDLAGGGSAPFTPGSVPFADASGFFIQDNANFFWDDPNNLLTSGVGLKIRGATSGVVTVNTRAAAGTWTLTLPDTAGTSGYTLTTNGSGVTSWTSAGGGGGMAIGGAISGSTASRVLFTGAGGILDDDSTFTWNDTLKDLAIGGAYYVNAARALYVVPNVSGNNWFEGSAGNQTVTGYNNFGTGDNSLKSITTGYENVSLGSNALTSLTDGYGSFALGSSALRRNVSDFYNIAIGQNALYRIGESGTNSPNNIFNVAIGNNSMYDLVVASQNVAIGANSLGILSPATATSNTVVGHNAGANLGSGSSGSVGWNTMIGQGAGQNVVGASSGNTWIGGWYGPSAAMNNVIVISGGGGSPVGMMDFHLTAQYVWSFNQASNTVPAKLHVYNHQSPAFAATNYDRAIIGWDDYAGWANQFRIGTEAGGSGVIRIVMIDGFPKAGAPANTDLLAGCFAVIDDTSGGADLAGVQQGRNDQKGSTDMSNPVSFMNTYTQNIVQFCTSDADAARQQRSAGQRSDVDRPVLRHRPIRAIRTSAWCERISPNRMSRTPRPRSCSCCSPMIAAVQPTSRNCSRCCHECKIRA